MHFFITVPEMGQRARIEINSRLFHEGKEPVGWYGKGKVGTFAYYNCDDGHASICSIPE